MRRKKRFLPYLILSIFSFLILILLIFTTNPTGEMKLGPLAITFSSIIVLPLLSFTFFLPSYVLKNKIHGILLSIFIILALFLHSHGLTHPFFFLLLFALLLTLELLFTKKKA